MYVQVVDASEIFMWFHFCTLCQTLSIPSLPFKLLDIVLLDRLSVVENYE